MFFRKASKSCSENFFLKSFERYFVLTFCRFEGLFWRENCFLMMSIFLERERAFVAFFLFWQEKNFFVAFCLDLTAHCSFLPSRYIVPLSFLWMFFVKCLFLFCFSGISLFFIFTFLSFFSVFFLIHLRWFLKLLCFFALFITLAIFFLFVLMNFQKKNFCFCDLKKKISCSKKSFHVKKGLKNGEKVRTKKKEKLFFDFFFFFSKKIFRKFFENVLKKEIVLFFTKT